MMLTQPIGLPDASEIHAEQLVIHADFPLASHHRLVRELESLRITVSQELDLPVSDEIVHLYLFHDTKSYSEYAAVHFPQFPTRRAFFVETDTSLAVFAPWQDRIAEDLRHETTHGYVHAVVPNIPLWLDEGLAEFFEVPRVTGGLHAEHLANLTGRLLEGTWQPDLERLERIKNAGDLTQDHYAEAWAWSYLMLRTTPERRAALEDFLRDLRKDVHTPPLSLRLSRINPSSHKDLVEHLQNLNIHSGK